MRRKSRSLLKKYLKGRVKTLRDRPKLIKSILDSIVDTFGNHVTIIVFGGRGCAEKLYSSEPRDLDLLVITDLDEHSLTEKIIKIKPRTLPLDLIVVNVKSFNRRDPLTEKMLSKSIVVYDGLKIFGGS